MLGRPASNRARIASASSVEITGSCVSYCTSHSARGGTPASVVSTLAAEMQRIFNDSEVLARLAPIGYQPGTSGPGPLAATIARDLRKWENVVRDAGIEPQ